MPVVAQFYFRTSVHPYPVLLEKETDRKTQRHVSDDFHQSNSVGDDDVNQNTCLFKHRTICPTSINQNRFWCLKPTWMIRSHQIPMISVPLSCLTPDEGNTLRNDSNRAADRRPALPQLLPTKAPPATATSTASPLLKLPSNADSHQGQTTKAPTKAPEKPHNPAGNFTSPLPFCFFNMFVKWSLSWLSCKMPAETTDSHMSSVTSEGNFCIYNRLFVWPPRKQECHLQTVTL